MTDSLPETAAVRLPELQLRLMPDIQRSLDVLCTIGMWAYPQPEHVRPKQDALLSLGFAEHATRLEDGVERHYIVPTNAGRERQSR